MFQSYDPIWILTIAVCIETARFLFQGFTHDQIYVCESKYNKKMKSFRKIKALTGVVKPSGGVNITSRVVPMVPTRKLSLATATEDPAAARKLTPIPYNKPITKERKVSLIHY